MQSTNLASHADIVKNLEFTRQILRDQEHLACSLAETLANLYEETDKLVVQCKGLQLEPAEHSRKEEKQDLFKPIAEKETLTDIASKCASTEDPGLERRKNESFATVLPGSIPTPEEAEVRDDSRKGSGSNNRLWGWKSNNRSRGLEEKRVNLDRLREYANEMEDTKGSECVMPDPEELKDDIRKKLEEQAYDPCNFYKDTGLSQRIARTNLFELASMILLVTSSVWIAVEMDNNDSMSLYESGVVFQVVAHLFCFGFVLELVIRIRAFKSIRYALQDYSCNFDAVLVFFIVLETWILGTISAISGSDFTGGRLKTVVVFRVLRLLRLLRVLRLVRILRHVPQLMVIVRGLGIAVRAVACVLMLLLIIIYAGAIVARGLFEGSTFGDVWFPSVASSMGTLMLECTLSGSRGTSLMREAYAESPIYAFLLLLFVLLANVTMMGILAGILVQTVRTVAEVEREEKTVKDLGKMIEKLWDLAQNGDTDGDEKISAVEFNNLFSERDTARIMQTMDVDVEGLINVSGFVFEQMNGRLGMQDFLRMVLDLRGNKKATVKDHIETRKFIHSRFQDLVKQET